MKSALQIINKLRKPPAAHNWVKNIKLRRDETAFSLRNFALNPPRTSLLGAVTICIQIVVDEISLEQAIICANSIKDKASRERAIWIIRAFHPFARREKLRGIQVFRNMAEFYPVSAGVRVPVKPAFVVNQNGQLTPYLMICWAKMDLSHYQWRILATLISEAILSLEDFQGSDAYVICSPVAPYSKKERYIRLERISSITVLSDEERQSLFDRYAGALNDAERMIIDSLS